jgi:atypical dual specificity phosphatase
MSFEIHAQQIIPGVYLGNRNTIIGPDDFLGKYEIDVVISALTEEEYEEHMIEAVDMEGREWHRLVIDDEPLEPISSHFDYVHLVIRKALAANKRVLVHCSAGISRSATLVAAYLILERQLTAEESINFILRRRENVCPNNGFHRQLKALEEERLNNLTIKQ